MPIPKKWKKELPPSDDPQRPPKGLASTFRAPKICCEGCKCHEENDGRA